jgi:hypothetical protein
MKTTKAKTPKPDTSVASAKKYVDAQLATMKKHGGAPTLTEKQYQGLINKVALATSR